MNKKMNVLKVGFALAAAIVVTGCASVGGIANNMVNNKDKSGVIYGAAGAVDEPTVEKVCAAIANKDHRCNEANKYLLVGVISKAGFADGAVGVYALIEKNSQNANLLKHKYVTGDKNIPYIKAKVTPGQLGEVLEVVSVNGEGKCEWSGMPRIGGVVCPAYNWDYRKDNQAAIIFH